MSEVTVTPAIFRQCLPAFSDAAKYPDDMLHGIIDTAECYVSVQNGCLLKDSCRVQAICLMAAHLLILRERMAQGGNTGAVGAVASSAVGNVSVSLVLPPNRDQREYWLNLTGYGAELMRLLDLFGTGGMYVGGSYETVLR